MMLMTPMQDRVVLSMMVKKAGLPVAFACNGLECVKAFQSQPPGSYCMILMDLHMPCMDGFTATQMLRHKETSLVPAARPSHATGASQPAKRGPCAVPRPQAPPWGRWLDRDTNGCLNLQRIGESKQRPLELCQWDDLEALPPVGKEYQQRYKLVNDRLPKVRQRLHRAAEYRRGIDGRACNNA
ncbi:hypothetical protein QJQ45_011994 [Haematococcus lacustris]|nr:hypothetical protein QJQ45_011994 [Haematococcus lacustris]